MKILKIKNLENRDEVLSNLIENVKRDEKWSPLSLEENLPNYDFYVIEENGKIIPAYISYKKDEALLLWVQKDFRRQGYGKFLVDSLKVKYVRSIEISIPFWEKIGFKKKGGIFLFRS